MKAKIELVLCVLCAVGLGVWLVVGHPSYNKAEKENVAIKAKLEGFQDWLRAKTDENYDAVHRYKVEHAKSKYPNIYELNYGKGLEAGAQFMSELETLPSSREITASTLEAVTKRLQEQRNQ